jgi:hypothetical protein
MNGQPPMGVTRPRVSRRCAVPYKVAPHGSESDRVMNDETPPKRIDPGRGDGGVREGDIMVTAVGGLFAIGRLKADRESRSRSGPTRVVPRP